MKIVPTNDDERRFMADLAEAIRSRNDTLEEAAEIVRRYGRFLGPQQLIDLILDLRS